MKTKFRFKQRMMTLCCVPLVLLTVISVVIGLIQFKDGMYKETKNSLHSSAIAALNLYDSQGYGDYALKSYGDVWRGMNFDVSTETFIVDGLKEKTGVDITFFYEDTAVLTSITNEDNVRWMGMQAGDNIKNYTLAQGAEQSNNSAAQIGENIQELVNKTEGIVSAMAMIGDTLKAQEASVDQTKKIFDELSESIVNVNQKESDMQKNVEDMTQAKENMSHLIAGLADSAEDSAAVSENAETMTEQMVSEMEGLASLTSDLTELANKLNENLERFLG